MWIFRSIRFNVYLFLLIAGLAALGTFVPQITDNADRVSTMAANHPYISEGFSILGIFDLYHTFFFAGLLALMAFDVVVCKLWRKPPDHGLVEKVQDASDDDVTLRALHKKPLRLQGSVDLPLD